jgi:hypothetical protein
MRWQLAAGALEFVGNAALVYTLLTVGRRPWPSIALKQLATVAAIYAGTNVFYAAAYIGRLTGSFEWWDTPPEKVVLAVQVGSMWALLLTGIEAVVAASE